MSENQCPEILVRNSMSGNPCLEIHVRKSMFGNPRPEIHVRKSLSGNPCTEIHVRKSMSGNPCPEAMSGNPCHVRKSMSQRPCRKSTRDHKHAVSFSTFRKQTTKPLTSLHRLWGGHCVLHRFVMFASLFFRGLHWTVKDLRCFVLFRCAPLRPGSG